MSLICDSNYCNFIAEYLIGAEVDPERRGRYRVCESCMLYYTNDSSYNYLNMGSLVPLLTRDKFFEELYS